MKNWSLGITTRQLSLLRVALSLLWMAGLVIRWPLQSTYFSDEGLLPYKLARVLSDNVDAIPSINLFFSNNAIQIIFILGFFSGFFLLLGVQSRVFAPLTFIFMVLIDGRNQFVIHAGHEMTRALVFWLIFLPLDEFYSFSKKKIPFNQYIYNWFSISLILQILFFYFFGALLKTSEAWRSTGTALEMAFSSHLMAWPWLREMATFTSILKALTPGVYCFELIIPILLVFFWNRKKIRRILVGTLMGFHLIILVGFKIGLLPLVSLAALICLWPFGFSTSTVIKTERFYLGLPLGIYLLAVNLSSLPYDFKINRDVFLPARALLMDQAWMFFAPHPYAYDGWWSIEGIAPNRERHQLKINGEPLIEGPQSYYWNKVSVEDRTFLMHLLKDQYADYRQILLVWLCRNNKTQDQIRSIEFTFYKATLPYPREIGESYTPHLLGRVECP